MLDLLSTKSEQYYGVLIVMNSDAQTKILNILDFSVLMYLLIDLLLFMLFSTPCVW